MTTSETGFYTVYNPTPMLRLTLLGVLVAATLQAPQVDKSVRDTFGAGGRNRIYYRYVPSTATPETPAPMLVLLHGSGRDGRSLLDPWVPFAKENGIVLVAPEAVTRQAWSMRDDGPDFLYALIELIRLQYPVDPRRIYLFGHSAGAVHGLAMAVLESEYFAAVAVHAGSLPEQVTAFAGRAPRKTPIGIWVGTNDALFPLPQVRATRDALNAQGFGAQLTEIGGHTHAYYDRAAHINRQVWAFLEKHRLNGDPKYQAYQILQ
jgi:poly(3-hydroxybutyrate) depolymerase